MMRFRRLLWTLKLTKCVPTASFLPASRPRFCPWRSGISCFEIEERMLIIEQLVGDVTPTELGAREEDSIALTWEQRRWLRGKFTTKFGREFALALPTGSVLADGAILCLQPDWYLRVQAAPEPVLAVQPKN